MCGKNRAILCGGVFILPELDEGVGIRIFEPGFAQMVEGGDGGLLRVGDDAVNSFLTVDVGLVFVVTAEGVADRLEQETGDGNGEEEHEETGAAGEGSSIMLAAQFPARAETACEPCGKCSAGPVNEEQARQPIRQ